MRSVPSLLEGRNRPLLRYARRDRPLEICEGSINIGAMLLIILRRLGQSVFVLFLVAFVSFMIFRYVGNPVDNLLGQEASNDRRDALIEALGLNDPCTFSILALLAVRCSLISVFPTERHSRLRT